MSESSERQRHLIIDEVRRLLAADDTADIVAFVEPLHPSDLADVLEHLEDDERLRVLELIPAPLASDSLAEMEEEEHPAELLAQMEPERIAELFEELADDDAADLIGELEPEEQERVLESVADSDELRELLEYPEDSAGGIMTRELVSVRSTANATEAIDELREHASDREDFYTVFVVDRDARLRGVVTLRDLILASPSTSITELLEDPVAVVPVDMDQEEVGRILSRYNLASIGVVDDEGRLVGRITFDDVIDVVEAETTEDILRFASVSDEEQLRGTTAGAIRSRLPWLAVNTITLSLAALVVWAYKDTIEQLAILAAVMPVIAGLGGNAGTQALAVTIRRIAIAEETAAERWSAVWKELIVGLVNGLLIGGLVALVALALPDTDPVFGGVVMIAMWGNLVVASTLGAFFPIVLERSGIDPAVASSIFVTTFTDLFGFLLLLGLASSFLL
ncbi:MAG: magnesium transporter [Gemmatimonadetes bacterium]|nr:magnesium transporter [Gemmatimonadota bacterium]